MIVPFRRQLTFIFHTSRNSELNWISIGYGQAPVQTECQTESTYASLLDYLEV
jgi:hypothetical protein